MPKPSLDKYPLPQGMKCPKCNSVDIRRSKTEGLMGILHGMFGRYPFRCRSCRAKFYRSDIMPQNFQVR